MSLRSTVRGIVFATAGAAAVFAVVAASSPQVRQRALELLGRRAEEPEPQQPTHIVLPDRQFEAAWVGLDEAIEEGRSVGSADIALAGA